MLPTPKGSDPPSRTPALMQEIVKDHQRGGPLPAGTARQRGKRERQPGQQALPKVHRCILPVEFVLPGL